MDPQKNRLIEMVILSIHNICFGSEIRKIFFGTRPNYECSKEPSHWDGSFEHPKHMNGYENNYNFKVID